MSPKLVGGRGVRPQEGVAAGPRVGTVPFPASTTGGRATHRCTAS